MGTTTLRKDRMLILLVIGILVAAAGVWGLTARSPGDRPAVQLPEPLSVDALKTQADRDPTKAMDRVHEAFRREDLTDDQRQQLRANVRDVMRAEFKKRMDAYFGASETERVAILDRQIDEMQVRIKAWRQRRAQWARERSTGPGASDKAGSSSGRGRRGPRTREQRKARSESRSPDEMARHMAYFTAMRKRAKERGIEMPFRGGGHRGRP